MPEFFDITLIGKKTNNSKLEMAECINKLGLLSEGNISNNFDCKNLIVSNIEDGEDNFEITTISIPGLVFKQCSFDDELTRITTFVNHCFEISPNLQYALCSFEINGYLIDNRRNIQDFDTDSFLEQFPIVYKRIGIQETPKLVLNLNAQDIFSQNIFK